MFEALGDTVGVEEPPVRGGGCGPRGSYAPTQCPVGTSARRSGRSTRPRKACCEWHRPPPADTVLAGLGGGPAAGDPPGESGAGNSGGLGGQDGAGPDGGGSDHGVGPLRSQQAGAAGVAAVRSHDGGPYGRRRLPSRAYRALCDRPTRAQATGLTGTAAPVRAGQRGSRSVLLDPMGSTLLGVRAWPADFLDRAGQGVVPVRAGRRRYGLAVTRTRGETRMRRETWSR